MAKLKHITNIVKNTMKREERRARAIKRANEPLTQIAAHSMREETKLHTLEEMKDHHGDTRMETSAGTGKPNTKENR
jgi:hypothetical protein